MAIATVQELNLNSPILRQDSIDIAKSLQAKDLFLSHSFSDVQVAKDAVALLQQHGANVYWDIDDVTLRTSASPADVAGRLRKAIEHCRRLVVVVTENTHTSRWIPWEMGLADGFSTTSRVALFPLRSSATASALWASQEYFDLYARVERIPSHTGSGGWWAVRIPSGQYYTLDNWLVLSKPLR